MGNGSVLSGVMKINSRRINKMLPWYGLPAAVNVLTAPIMIALTSPRISK
jgi:hypothetical protein